MIFQGYFIFTKNQFKKYFLQIPKERSRGVDRLLGTYEIREFTEALDLDRYFNKRSKSLDDELDRIGADKQKLAGNMRKLLLDKKQKLVADGYQEQELSLEFSSIQLSSMITEVNLVASRYDPSAHKMIYPLPEIDQMRDESDKITAFLHELEQKRIKASTEIEKRIDLISRSREAYVEAQKELALLGQSNLEQLEFLQAQHLNGT